MRERIISSGAFQWWTLWLSTLPVHEIWRRVGWPVEWPAFSGVDFLDTSSVQMSGCAVSCYLTWWTSWLSLPCTCLRSSRYVAVGGVGGQQRTFGRLFFSRNVRVRGRLLTKHRDCGNQRAKQRQQHTTLNTHTTHTRLSPTQPTHAHIKHLSHTHDQPTHQPSHTGSTQPTHEKHPSPPSFHAHKRNLVPAMP